MYQFYGDGKLNSLHTALCAVGGVQEKGKKPILNLFFNVKILGVVKNLLVGFATLYF